VPLRKIITGTILSAVIALASPALSLTSIDRQTGPMDSKTFLNELLNLPQVFGTKLSPDNKWVAWTWTHTGPAANVFAAPSDGSVAPRKLTSYEDDTFVSSWIPYTTELIVKHDTDGDERVTLFRMPSDGSAKPVALTDIKPDYYVSGGQMHYLKPWLFYAANYDFEKKKEIEPALIYRHELDTGKHVVVARPLKANGGPPLLNKQGTHLIYPRSDIDPGGQQIWLVDVEGKSDQEILNFGPKKKVFATWMDDGKRVVFVAEADKHRKVGIYDIDSKAVKWLIDDPTRNIEGVHAPINAGNTVVLTEIKTGKLQASLLDTVSGATAEVHSDGGNIIPIAPIDGPEGRWVAVEYSAAQPNHLVVFDRGKTVKDITRMWEGKAIKKQDLQRPEDFSWKSVDGLTIHGLLYKTAAHPKGTIVLVHGGPTGHDEDEFDPQIQFFVHDGFNVFQPNYRGSTGYGLEFEDAIKKEGWGGKEQDDIRTGVEALIKAGFAQPGKVGITGTSYGGYSSWFAITHFPVETIAASAPICGMTDLVVDYETTRPDLRPYSEEMMGGSPKEVPERYKERSPINYVQNIKGKLLIVQGMQDPNVTPENVKQVEAALKKNGIDYELMTFADEGHGIARKENEKKLAIRLAEFFTKAFQTN
jgi:dipeptidyl aminopeptidase/acylaminoacyl peptidase